MQLFKACQSVSKPFKSHTEIPSPAHLGLDPSTERPHALPFLIAIDISPDACAASVETAAVNGVRESLDVVNSSLFQSLRKANADVVIFNPVRQCVWYNVQ